MFSKHLIKFFSVILGTGPLHAQKQQNGTTHYIQHTPTAKVRTCTDNLPETIRIATALSYFGRHNFSNHRKARYIKYISTTKSNRMVRVVVKHLAESCQLQWHQSTLNNERTGHRRRYFFSLLFNFR
jgi:hypothetical protein